MNLHVNLESGYDIYIGHHLLDEITKYLPSSILEGKIMIVSDEHIPASYREAIYKKAHQVVEYIITPGEESKSLASYEAILKQMLDHQFSRTDTVIAIGGGVVGDLAGFVAASYKRGCTFINIPTSTLSMVDSSIGGKVAVNLEHVKNAVGFFYQPKMVLIDLDTLQSLPKRQYYNGLVEALKMGLIMDKDLFSLFSDLDHNLEEIIYRSLDAKRKVVETDEKETGLRKILNFGHTIGHGIESAYLGEIYHGEAVALGMLPWIIDESLKQQVIEILDKMQINIPSLNKKDAIYQAILNDKKRHQDDITVVQVLKLGQYQMVDVPLQEIKQKIKEMK